MVEDPSLQNRIVRWKGEVDIGWMRKIKKGGAGDQQIRSKDTRSQGKLSCRGDKSCIVLSEFGFLGAGLYLLMYLSP